MLHGWRNDLKKYTISKWYFSPLEREPTKNQSCSLHRIMFHSLKVSMTHNHHGTAHVLISGWRWVLKKLKMFAASSVQNSSYINLLFKLLYFLVLTFSGKRCFRVKHEICANANNVIQLLRGKRQILVNFTTLIANFNAT